MQNIFIELLPPWIETGLQPAFYDKESGTVLQQVSRMWAKMIQLGQAFNTFSEDTTTFVNQFVDDTNATVDEYIAKFVELHDYVEDYFANLDVQEEINNKLDAMVEAGTLQEIIDAYLDSNVTWVFDTVADMKQATNLIDGSDARTLGFHNINDGGGATYHITNTGTANEMDVISVGSLFANLIDGENVKQYGAYGDNSHDDTDCIQQAVNNLRDVKIPSGTYLINAEADSKTDTTAGIVVPSNTNITLHPDAILKVIPNAVEWYDVFMLYRVDNITIKGGNILGDRDDHTYNGVTDEWGAGIKCIGATNVIIDNIKITDCTGDGIDIGDFVAQDFNENIIVQNCTIDNVRRNGISVENADGVKVINSRIVNVNGTAPQSAIDLEPNNIANDKVLNITIDKCFIDNCVGGGVSCWRADNVTLTNSYIKVPDSKVGFNTVASSDTQETNKNITVIGNVFDSYGTGWYLIGSNATTCNNQFNNTNIYVTESATLTISNAVFSSNIIKQGLLKTALGGGAYTVGCIDVLISNNTFTYKLEGSDVDPTGSALNGLQFELGTRDATGGKKISGIKVDGNIFEYTNTNIFTTPTAFISNKTSFDLGLIDSEFTNNTVRNMPYAMLCSKLPKVKFSGNKLYNVGFLWAYRGLSVQNESTSLFNFDNNVFEYDTTTPPSQVVYIQGMNHIVNNTLQSTTTVPDCFLKLLDGAVSYVYNNFATSSTTNGVISCYNNAGSIHAANNEN